jgi:hypothetical protein
MKLAIQTHLNSINFSNSNKIAIGAALLTGGIVMAGTTGTEFQAFFTMMEGWASGYLGKGIAFAALIFGAGVGVAKQDMTPAVVGVLFALIFTVGPSVINGMMTAVI